MFERIRNWFKKDNMMPALSDAEIAEMVKNLSPFCKDKPELCY